MTKKTTKPETPVTPVETPETPVETLSPTTLGRLRASYTRLESALISQSISGEEIGQRVLNRMTEDALTYNVSLESLQSQLETLSDTTPEGIESRKKQYRNEFDRLTNNLLFAVANSSDSRVIESHNALLEYDRLFQKITGMSQSDRDDWRGMVMIKSHWTDSCFVIHKGGWSDPVKRDQYSNGRRVPVAKSTGYTREQKNPEWTATP